MEKNKVVQWLFGMLWDSVSVIFHIITRSYLALPDHGRAEKWRRADGMLAEYHGLCHSKFR